LERDAAATEEDARTANPPRRVEGEGKGFNVVVNSLSAAFARQVEVRWYKAIVRSPLVRAIGTYIRRGRLRRQSIVDGCELLSH
jgi:hypothetical protein